MLSDLVKALEFSSLQMKTGVSPQVTEDRFPLSWTPASAPHAAGRGEADAWDPHPDHELSLMAFPGRDFPSYLRFFPT